MIDSHDYTDIACDHVLTGTTGSVVMSKAVTEEFMQLETKKQARLLSNAKLWADGYNPAPEQFQGNEGRCGGKNDRMLAAIKVHKIRLYGFIRRYKGNKILFIVDIDSAKKQDKANIRILKRAKNLANELDIICGD